MSLIDFISNLGTIANTPHSLDRRTFLAGTVGIAALATIAQGCETSDELVVKSNPVTEKEKGTEKNPIQYDTLPPQLQSIYTDLKKRDLLGALEAILPEYNGFDLIAKKEAVFTRHGDTIHSELELREMKAVTHLFWAELNSVVPWSVGEYTAIEMAGLTTSDSSKYGISAPIGKSVNYKYAKMRSEVDKVFPITMQVLKEAKVKTQTEAISAVVEWAEKNLFHMYYGWEAPAYEYPDAQTSDTSIEDIFKDRGLGCHLASMVVATMLRSVNVPADYILDPLLHGSAYFPTTKQFVHGDFIANYVAMPVDQLLMDEKEWTYWTQDKNSYEKYFKAQYAKDSQNHVLSNPLLRRNTEGLYVIGGPSLQRHPTSAELDYFATKLPEFQIAFEPYEGFLGSKGWGKLVGKGIVPVQVLE